MMDSKRGIVDENGPCCTETKRVDFHHHLP